MKLHRLSAPIFLLCTLASGAAWAQAADAPSPASAANKATARELTVQGYAALERKDYGAAADLFSRAETLYHAPTVALGLGRANLGLGKLLAAQENFNSIAHETVPPNAPAAFVRAIEDAKQELRALEGRVPGILIQVSGATAPRVTLDGVEVPSVSLGVRRPVDPGRHVIRAFAEGSADGEATITVPEGKTETAILELKPGTGTPIAEALGHEPPHAAFGVRRTAGFIGIGLGGAGLVAGGVMGVMALVKDGNLASKCPNGVCPSNLRASLQPDVDAYNTMKTGAIVGLAAGGALAVAGAVLLFTGPKAQSAQSDAQITPLIGFGFVGVGGTF